MYNIWPIIFLVISYIVVHTLIKRDVTHTVPDGVVVGGGVLLPERVSAAVSYHLPVWRAPRQSALRTDQRQENEEFPFSLSSETVRSALLAT